MKVDIIRHSGAGCKNKTPETYELPAEIEADDSYYWFEVIEHTEKEKTMTPAGLESVELVPHESGQKLIKITTFDGAQWYYLQTNKGKLILGSPLSYNVDDHMIYLFVPLAPGELPIILGVKHYNESIVHSDEKRSYT